VEPLTFTCPRCGRDVAERFFGPCTGCREELRATMARAPAAIDATYQPRSNVVPNHVASREE
jgi:hypothetical protein